MALAHTKFENIDENTRRQARTLHRQLATAADKPKATIEVEGSMVGILLDFFSMLQMHPGLAITPLNSELSPEDAGKILGVSRPLVVRRMDDGQLPFRYEGKHRRSKLEDVLRLRDVEAARTRATSAHAPHLTATENLDELVLGTTNAPYRRSIDASELTDRLKSADIGPWMVHLATFFTEVRPELVLMFAEHHGISIHDLSSTYGAVKASTGEANPALEIAFEQLADTP